jgi:hypothetical protein
LRYVRELRPGDDFGADKHAQDRPRARDWGPFDPRLEARLLAAVQRGEERERRYARRAAAAAENCEVCDYVRALGGMPNDRRLKLLAAYRSQRKAYGGPVDPRRVFWLRDHMDPSRPTGRPVLITTVRTADGGAVPAFAYGDLDRANHELFTMMLALAVAQATPALGTCPVSAAAALYEGHRTVASIPIEKWVSVMDLSWLSAWSSLPPELFQFVLSPTSQGPLRRGTGLYRCRGLVPRHYEWGLMAVGESGPTIVVGSSATPAVFALFVAAAIHNSGIETRVTPVGHGDLALCRDAAAATALMAALLQLDGGPDDPSVLTRNPNLSMTGNDSRRAYIARRLRGRSGYVLSQRMKISDASEGFRLGNLQMRWTGDAVTVTPPDREMARFRVRVKQSLAEGDEEGARAFVRK